ncbi:MAG: hypothetical protein ACTSR6_13265, partial [Candidatus Heimdallarchaeota archaeon]
SESVKENEPTIVLKTIFLAKFGAIPLKQMALGPSLSSRVPTQIPIILEPSVLVSYKHNFQLISVKFRAIKRLSISPIIIT